MIPSRAGQVWLTPGGHGGTPWLPQPVLLLDVVVPSWGPGYEEGVHLGCYLEAPEHSVLLEESYLAKGERVT